MRLLDELHLFNLAMAEALAPNRLVSCPFRMFMIFFFVEESWEASGWKEVLFFFNSMMPF